MNPNSEDDITEAELTAKFGPIAKLSEVVENSAVDLRVGIDESGTADVNPLTIYGMPFYVGCAAVARSEDFAGIERAFDSLEHECFGAAADDRFELHLKEIVLGESGFKKFDWPTRLKYVEGAIRIAAEHKVEFVVRGLHKASLVNDPELETSAYDWVAVRLLTIRDYNPSRFVWVSVDESIDRSMKRAYDEFKKKSMEGQLLADDESNPSSRYLLEFVESHENRLVQIADLGAYVHRFMVTLKFESMQNARDLSKSARLRRNRRIAIAKTFRDSLAGHVKHDEIRFAADDLSTTSYLTDVTGTELTNALRRQRMITEYLDHPSGQVRPRDGQPNDFSADYWQEF